MTGAEDDTLRRLFAPVSDGVGAVTLADLADLLPITEPHLRNIRDGRRRLTTRLHTEILDALRALGVDIRDLPRPAGDE